MVGFSDSYYVDSLDDKNSTYGYIYMMDKEAISRQSVWCVKRLLVAIWSRNFILALVGWGGGGGGGEGGRSLLFYFSGGSDPPFPQLQQWQRIFLQLRW